MFVNRFSILNKQTVCDSFDSYKYIPIREMNSFAIAGYGDICPRGYFCPAGSVIPQGCPAGTYQDLEGEYTCKTCPAGMVFVT